MELRQIRYFTVVADELSFTRAARRLHVSQPPLSFQIASLEAELGARLFNRTSRSVALSEAGKAFLPHAQAVLARLEEARGQVRRVASGLQGRVQVGLAGSHFLGPFPKFIQQFRLQRPAVEIVLHEMKPSDHLQALRDGRLDLCVSRNPLEDAQISAGLLWRDPVVVALPPGHRLAARSRLRLAALKDEEFVFLRLDSSPFAARLFEACVQAGFAPHIAQQVIEVPAALNLVAAGLGVALVPASLALLRADAVGICSLSPPALKRAQAGDKGDQGGAKGRMNGDGPGPINGDVYVLWRSGDTAPAVATFREQLLDWARTLPPQRGR
ncbi:MAG: LysR substrate-binding domain-containing protein [Polaromonas sp.]|nr:LysR substrate-binding domain-containing protein [Polaromonas sp.]